MTELKTRMKRMKEVTELGSQILKQRNEALAEIVRLKQERDELKEALKVERGINDAFYEYGLGIWDTYVSDRISNMESVDDYRSARPFEETLNAYYKLERVTAKYRAEYRKRQATRWSKA